MLLQCCHHSFCICCLSYYHAQLLLHVLPNDVATMLHSHTLCTCCPWYYHGLFLHVLLNDASEMLQSHFVWLQHFRLSCTAILTCASKLCCWMLQSHTLYICCPWYCHGLFLHGVLNDTFAMLQSHFVHLLSLILTYPTAFFFHIMHCKNN
jgi:hypothetical protein